MWTPWNKTWPIMDLNQWVMNSTENQDYNERRHYRGNAKSDIINFPVSLRKGFLSPKVNNDILNSPVSAVRIIFKVINDVSFDQFRKENKGQIKQFNLFEDDFRTEHNTYARFTFKVTDIADKRDYTNVQRGLEFLENCQKGWYQSRNEKGKIIKSYGGFISNPSISEGKITFLISSFWFEKIVLLTQYNSANTEIAWKLTKSKHILFYLWLLEVPDSGTKVNFHKLQEAYDYHYKNANTFAKNVLKSLRVKLNKYGNRSFNYSVSGELINIVPYYTTSLEEVKKEKTNINQEITQKMSYWKNRHALSNDQVRLAKEVLKKEPGLLKLFKTAYERLVTFCRKDKVKVTELQGVAFLEAFQKEIISVYKASAWNNISPNGYPNIILK